MVHPSQEKEQRPNLCLGSVKTLDCCDSEAYSIQGSVSKMSLLLSLRRSRVFKLNSERMLKIITSAFYCVYMEK